MSERCRGIIDCEDLSNRSIDAIREAGGEVKLDSLGPISVSCGAEVDTQGTLVSGDCALGILNADNNAWGIDEDEKYPCASRAAIIK